MASDKRPSIITLVNADSWFINEYHIHPVIHILLFLFNLIFFYVGCLWCCFLFAFSVYKSHFIQHFTLLSQTLTYLFFNLFCCTFSIFNAILLWVFHPQRFHVFFRMSPFHPISFIFARNFRHDIFRHTLPYVIFLNEFYDPFHN